MNPVAFQRRFREALESLNAGDTASASNSCATLLGAAPDHPGVLQLQATILLRRNEPQAALQFARRSLASRPEHVPSLILAARAARAAGLLAPAAAFLHSATAHAPGLAEPVFLACHVFLEQNDTSLDAALADAHARFPGHASEWQVLGLALQRAGRREAALAAFTAAPNSASAQFGRGLLLREFGRNAEAREVLAKATALDPGRDAAWFALGLTCQDLGDEQAAAGAYQSALDARPDFAEAAVNLGIARQRCGDMAGAVTAYRRAMQIRPETFSRISQAMSASSTGMLWLDLEALRHWLLEPKGKPEGEPTRR